MAVDSRGNIVIVEIKVSRADLLATANGPTIWRTATVSTGRSAGIRPESVRRRGLLPIVRADRC